MLNWLFDNILVALIGSVITMIVNYLVLNRKYLRILSKTMLHRNKPYRITYAYLFRVRIDNKYLLIKGNRINQFQPLGGVYKYYDSFKLLFEKWEVNSEKDNNFYEDRDLRIFVKGKYIPGLLKWIDSGKNRECDHLREFYEELIVTGFLSEDILAKVNFEYLKRINTGVHYSTHFKCDEISIFDIIDTGEIDDEVKKTIIDNIEKHDNYVLVSQEEIEKECFYYNGLSTKIGKQCKYIV